MKEFQVVAGDDNAKVLVFHTRDDDSFYATSHKVLPLSSPHIGFYYIVVCCSARTSAPR